MKLKLEGIWTPIPTPLTTQGKIDKEATKKLVDFHIESGIDGILPLGTSGEFALLIREERKLLVETVVDEVNGRVPVVAGVSDPSLENVLQLSADAKDAGADAVIATPPYYFTTTDQGHYHHFKTISESIDLPLLIYNIPEWTHSFVTPDTVQRLAQEKLVVGMKHTACYEEFEEGKLQDHIRIKHGFETRLQSEYLASLERRIKALEDKR